MKKNTILISALLVIVFAILLIASHLISNGFTKRTDVVLIDYSVSEDGSKLTFKTAVLSSMGFIRGFEDNGGGAKQQYLTFYSTFGRLNSSFGAKHEFELELAETDTEIYFNRANGDYELVLQKNKDTGEWVKP